MSETKPSPDKYNILVVDDDPEILLLMKDIFEPEGFNIITADNGYEALGIIDKEQISLVLLDIMLPDIDGNILCKCIRVRSRLPIIMVTARNSEDEKVECLKAGADDYITKPFSPRELSARVMSVLRRSSFPAIPPYRKEYRFMDLHIDFKRHIAKKGGNQIDFTITEFRLLRVLAASAGRMVANETLLKEVWGDEFALDLHRLHVNISRIRRKLNGDTGRENGSNDGSDSRDCSDAGAETYIETKQGLGYLLKGR
jgi:two-component system, OmpR family, alkaline phosphatase synthesis response regulator PhoP